MQQKDGSTIRYQANEDFIAIITAQDNPHSNLVRNIHGEDLHHVFEQLDKIYADKKQGYSITVRKTDNPLLREEIIKRGYTYEMSYDYMVLDLTQQSIQELEKRIKPSKYIYVIIKPEMSESRIIYQLVDNCFPGFYHDYQDYLDSEKGSTIALNDQNRKSLTIVACEDSKPIAFSKLTYNILFEDYHVGYLAGAGTQEDHRHQNIYTSMIYHRAKTAFNLGVDCLTVEANSATSAPILARYGFKIVEHVEVFLPPKSS